MSLVSLDFESLQGDHVCLLMEIIGKTDPAKTVARECETVLKHALLEAEGDAAERLDGTLKELNGLLKGMLVSGAVQDVHMLIGVADTNGMLHVSHAGRAEAYVVRKGVASQITEYAMGKPTPAFVHIASGAIEKNDVVIFSTERLLRSLTPAQLSRLAANRDTLMDMLERALETDSEHAALATMDFAVRGGEIDEEESGDEEMEAEPVRRGRFTREEETSRYGLSRRRQRNPESLLSRVAGFLPSLSAVRSLLPSSSTMQSMKKKMTAAQKSPSSKAVLSRIGSMEWVTQTRSFFEGLLADLHHPKRKKRAHLLLLASALAVLILLWAIVHLFTSTQRSKTRTDLQALVEQINVEMQTADNRRVIGDTDAANAILDRAAENAKQVMDNESGMYRQEAFNLLEQIQSKKEEINNIVRVSPRLVANISAKTPNILAQGMIGLGDGEFMVYDKQDVYHVLLNSVEDPHRLTEDAFVIDGAALSRFQSQVFLLSGNALVEWTNGQGISMKTDDPRGWIAGKAVAGYLRFLYILSPENKQIYKYERLSNRYGIPVEYNVNGDLTGAIDMTIDGSVFVLKEGGTVLKLFRGESQPFIIRKAPSELLKDTTKIFKVVDHNFYLLDPVGARVIVISDGGTTGESSYLKQYKLQGEQIGQLKGLYVDPDEAHLYVMDEKRVYVVDLSTK